MMSEVEAKEFYGKDAAEWLRRWDAGEIVHTIEMGGLGPGYEQCIHIVCAEILRHMIEANYLPESWNDEKVWKQVRDEIEAMSHKNATIKALGISGAQWGAAMNVALNIYRDGPAGIMLDKCVKDRHIQVSRTFPT
jgi:hypothetical protein